MIQLTVQEADAFDRLAILIVKAENGLTECADIRSSLNQQLGEETVGTIIGSPEFRELTEANRSVFHLVEKAKRDECKASDVDRVNHLRWVYKKRLQERFFGTPLTETKTERPYET